MTEQQASKVSSELDAVIERDLRELHTQCIDELGDEELTTFLMIRWRTRAMQFRSRVAAEIEARLATLH